MLYVVIGLIVLQLAVMAVVIFTSWVSQKRDLAAIEELRRLNNGAERTEN